MPTEKLLGLCRRLVLLRRLEERAYFLFLQGKIPGAVHQYQGQEAVAVGLCDYLNPTDWITSTYRLQGGTLAKGASPRER